MQEQSNIQTKIKEQKPISLQEASILLTEMREFFNKPDMTILGSIALKLHGFNVNIHDIDILIEYGFETERQSILDKLLLLEKMTDSKDVFHSDCTTKGETEGRWCFIYKGVKIDIWLRKKDLLQFSECKNANEFEINPYIWYNYMKVQPILTILDYKKRYARPKDFIVIEDLAAQILKKNE